MDLLLLESGAEFSKDRNHRYALWRIWNRKLPLVMFIGLNPSTANASSDDKTIESVTRIVRNNNFGGFYMMNCFSFVSKSPEDERIYGDQSLNNEWLLRVSNKCKDVVFAWGTFKQVVTHGRYTYMTTAFPKALCLGQNSDGSPKHPLYIKSNTMFVPFIPATSKIKL